MNIGIRGLGTYLPTRVMTAAEIGEKTGIPEDVIARKFGVKQKPIPGPEDSPSYMGLQAARRAVEQAGIDPGDIDLVIWNGGQHKDYPCWLAGLKVAHELGAENAWSFDMEAMCGSMMAGLDVAKSMLLAKDELHRVLLVSGYRNVDLIDLSVKETSFMADIGASGAAVLLEKGYNHNVVLGSSFRGDGSFAEDCVVPVLGAKAWPPKSEDAEKAHFVVRDVESFKKKLGERTMPNFYHVIRESLKRSGGLTDEHIDYLAILHFKRSAHDAVLKELNLKASQTTYLDEYGHLGQNDQVHSIELGVEQGKINDGDKIVMVGAGLGFVWASTVVHWGDYPEY
ncbi:MAG: 3-oxoacyl-ACP synthase [Spirochaetia bacterium]|nr:3-oxoacyl-ACP synthase [Spirochaetia bacterium]